jgi:hypothetical protein
LPHPGGPVSSTFFGDLGDTLPSGYDNQANACRSLSVLWS